MFRDCSRLLLLLFIECSGNVLDFFVVHSVFRECSKLFLLLLFMVSRECSRLFFAVVVYSVQGMF